MKLCTPPHGVYLSATPSDIIKQQQLPVDNTVLHEMSQQPSASIKARARMVSVSVSSVLPSRGGEPGYAD